MCRNWLFFCEWRKFFSLANLQTPSFLPRTLPSLLLCEPCKNLLTRWKKRKFCAGSRGEKYKSDTIFISKCIKKLLCKARREGIKKQHFILCAPDSPAHTLMLVLYRICKTWSEFNFSFRFPVLRRFDCERDFYARCWFTFFFFYIASRSTHKTTF